jgi:hypothetical protein
MSSTNTSYALQGETILIQADFKGYGGIGHIDPDNLKLRIFNSIKEKIHEVNLTIEDRISAGIYQHEYVVPETAKGQLTYEFSGTINGNPVKLREYIDPVWVVEEYKEPTLYQ